MRNAFILRVLLLAFGLSTLSAQMMISGELTPSAMFRLSNGELIDLPFRVGSINLNYAWGDLELRSRTALESRWKDPAKAENTLDIRELYVLWYPAFGEVKLGKMIHAWGAADANNPTDNLSPYDYYYMFMTGTDRKQGNLSAAVSAYLGDWQGQMVFTPEAKGNRFPFGEPDFPIQFPFEPETYEDLASPYEIGGRIQRAFNAADISMSYLKTHDQTFSLLALEGNPPNMGMRFGFRNTDVLGMDFVAFPGNWTLRGEGGYFRTKSPEIEAQDPSAMMFATFPVEAEYLQYVLQVEYQFANQVSLMAQMLGTEVLSAEGLMPLTTGGVTLVTKENFTPGLGTPFAMISDRVIMLSTMATMLDNALELSGMFMMNLAETGYMANAGATYSLMEGLNLEARLGYFLGDDEDENNRFTQLEDFSNLTIGLSYSF